MAGSGALTIPAGATSGRIEIGIAGDAVIEPNESFSLLLTNPVNALLASPSAIGTIVNDDFPPTLTLTVPSGPFAENSTSPITATIVRSGSTSGPLTVSLVSSDVTEATVPLNITIPAGNATTTFSIALVDDVIVDGSQMVNITATSSVSFHPWQLFKWTMTSSLPFFECLILLLSATALTVSGSAKVAHNTTYLVSRGYGFFGGTVASVDRGGASIVRDAIYTRDASFVVDVPNGNYTVDLILGDTAGYAHDSMGVYLEGALAATVSTPGGMLTSRSFQVSVSDKQLTMRLRDLGGSDANVVVQAMRVYATASAPSSVVPWPAQPTIRNAVFSGPSLNSDGFINFNVYSQYQRSVNTLRVLLPAATMLRSPIE